MKKFLIIMLVLLAAGITEIQAQAPFAVNYQGVARNSFGTVINNRSISIRLSVRNATAAGPVVYSESHTINTDQYGVFGLTIGGGTVISGTMAGVNWASEPKFLQVEMDANGGGSFTNMGTTQLVSVPYSIIAGGAPPIGPAGGDLAGTYPNPLLKLPNARSVADAGSLFTLTNTGTGAGSSAFSAITNSTASGVSALIGTVSSTTPGGFSAGVRGINNGTVGLGIGVWGSQDGSGWGVYGTANGGIGVNGSANSGIGVNGSSNTGTGGRFATTSGLALHTIGGVRLQGIGEALNRVLASDAAGNATWQTVAAIGAVTGSGTTNQIPKWTPSGTVLGNSLLFDNGSSVGLGTTTPTHRLDVTHGGSTGIGINSTSGFSVLDINAASGDAALRFGNAGVNQWNMRNNPGNDDLQFFELGGGGERMAIKNGTGNIAIGGSTGTYRLDILHGGSTGILNKSSSSFSVVDIDAASGDAAIRLANNGVNQWNIRNQPGTDNLQVFELGGGGERMHIQNGTGNVSIGGEPAPSYRLDVLHGGATGIRNRSTSSFSVFDIDAFSGDAAIRFANNGVNQWNIRNQPVTDNFQIFELGGGGERMHIQNSTGNVSIGGEPSPTYKLDVLHGGATGARIRSSSSFSVVDIDAASGDAALRFINNGLNQWNTRNNPGTDDYQIFELGGGGERMRIENTTGRVVVGGDFTVVGLKMFTMDHPLDPANKLLRHAAAESNEVINFYSGNVVTDAAGKAIVQLPDYYQALNKDSRYQLTVIGSFAQAIISKEVSNNQFEIATNQPNVKVSWEVKGVRNDNHMKQNPFVSVEEKSAAQKGTYWDPKAHNQPMTKHVSYNPTDEKSSLNYVPAADKKVTPATTGGSLDYVAPVNTSKKADVSGSIVDTPAEKKAEVKPADTKGTSVEDVKKAAEKTAPASTGGSVGETKQD